MTLSGDEAQQKNLEIMKIRRNQKRHTILPSALAAGTKNLLNDLEPVDEEIDYITGAPLAEGHVGQCYNALNNSSGKVIVIKTLDFTELSKEAVESRVDFLQENIEIIKSVESENTINYLTVTESDKKVNILMEYVPGGSLRYILNNFLKFKEKLVKSYVKQILQGLKPLHELGV